MDPILIVEDDADSRDALANMLRVEGHDVKCVASGAEALRSVLFDMPELIVLDLFMPDMNGGTLLEILRSYSRFRALPVIVWTGHADSSQAVQARRHRVEYIVEKGKPSYDAILTAIRTVLSHRPKSN
ncbi:MAG TPA: response regulator [Tepidisphaeraceae bacterium]|nr:response regulator [Tepidisphaeraceae bacterium]